MEKSSIKVAHDFSPFFKIYEDGYFERSVPFQKVPLTYRNGDECYKVTSTNPIQCKDVIISTKPAVSARIFMPKNTNTYKLPVLLYFHGGGFALRSAFEPIYHTYGASLAAEANVVVVSVEYRLAPEHPIPACYEDSRAALQWVASHANGHGLEPWLNDHGDLWRVFLAGDSAGANIAYNLAVRVGLLGLSPGLKLEGMVLAHPYFVGTKLDRVWLHLCPKNEDLVDPRIKPYSEDMARICCERMLVFVAGKDQLRIPGRSYGEDLKKSGWKGEVEIVEHEGVGHVFHLFKPNCGQALDLMDRFASFINQERPSLLRCRL